MASFFSLFSEGLGLRFKLRISRREDGADYSGGKRFRLAVVDLDRAKDYPLNFVCMLPMKIDAD